LKEVHAVPVRVDDLERRSPKVPLDLADIDVRAAETLGSVADVGDLEVDPYRPGAELAHAVVGSVQRDVANVEVDDVQPRHQGHRPNASA
jgi:hypothetical protein